MSRQILHRVRAPLDRMRYRLSGLETPPGLTLLSLLGTLCGLACGGVIVLFHALIDLFRHGSAGLDDIALGASVTVPLAVWLPILGALIVGLAYQCLARDSRDGGIVHIVERLTYHQGEFPWRNALAQFIGSVAAICTGQSVGREGVAAHMGATTSSWVGQWLQLPNNGIRTLVGCGTAAGIAASFNTPLAGVIFAMEVVMMEYTLAGFAPIILAAISATAVTHIWATDHPQLLVDAAELQSMIELPYLALCGCVLGTTAVAFTRLTRLLTRYLMPQPIWLRMLQAGIVAALCAWAFPQTFQFGFESINTALAAEFALGVALGVAAAKLVATAFAVSSLMPGGIIRPCLLMGAAIGQALGLIAMWLLGDSAADPMLYALLGMGAMMGAVLQAPLTALIAILELAGRTEMVFPAMLVVITAILVAREGYHSESIFLTLLRDRGRDYKNDPVSQSLRRSSVVSYMERSFRLTPLNITLAEAHDIVGQDARWILARRDDGRSGYLLPLADLLRYMLSEAGESLADDDTIALHKIPAVNRLQAGPIHLRATMQEAFDTLRRTEAEALYVQRRVRGDERTIYGVLTRDAIERAYLR